MTMILLCLKMQSQLMIVCFFCPSAPLNLNLTIIHLGIEKVDVEAWRKNISSET
jgi:hypothetical protein